MNSKKEYGVKFFVFYQTDAYGQERGEREFDNERELLDFLDLNAGNEAFSFTVIHGHRVEIEAVTRVKAFRVKPYV